MSRDLNGTLAGQLAVVTGQRDISAAAKVVKMFGTEFDKPEVQFGYLNNERLEQSDILTLADLPSMEVLRGKLLARSTRRPRKLVRLLNTPASQLARVLKAKVGKAELKHLSRTYNRFRVRLSRWARKTTNNNVNRRFAGSELKLPVAAGDDETNER